jgi:hypothetical protein
MSIVGPDPVLVLVRTKQVREIDLRDFADLSFIPDLDVGNRVRNERINSVNLFIIVFAVQLRCVSMAKIS